MRISLISKCLQRKEILLYHHFKSIDVLLIIGFAPIPYLVTDISALLAPVKPSTTTTWTIWGKKRNEDPLLCAVTVVFTSACHFAIVR